MNKIIRKAGVLCSLLVGLAFTACDNNDDLFESTATSPLMGTWDIAEGYDEAMDKVVPAYEYVFYTRGWDEENQKYEDEFKESQPESFEGVDRPVEYSRVVFSADLNGGKATFYTKNSSGNYVEGASYIATFLENSISLYYNDPNKTVEQSRYEYDAEGNIVEVKVQVVDHSLFKEFAVEKLTEDNLKIVWTTSERIDITYTQQYESYNFKRVK